jgi:protein ImuB
VSVEVESATGEVRHRVWRSGDPFDERSLSDRVWWQLRAWIEGTGVPGGIVRLRLDPSDLSGDGRQLALFEDVVAQEEADRALARAQALVGPDGVLGAVPQGGRMPGERVMWVRWGEEAGVPERDPAAPWPGATPGPEPALVPPRPPVLEVEWDGGIPVRVRLGSRWEPVHSWSGPWRLTGRWWAGEEPADRYQLVTAAGAFLCVVRDGRVHLAGIYD